MKFIKTFENFIATQSAATFGYVWVGFVPVSESGRARRCGRLSFAGWGSWADFRS